MQLIGNTKTKKGLKIQAQLDLRKYKTGIEISKKQVQLLNIKKSKFRSEWNYKISPKNFNL